MQNNIPIEINLDDIVVNFIVGSISARDRKILEELVRDTMLYGLNERESLMYVSKRAVGISISRANLYNIKKRISHNEVNMLEKRLTNHAEWDLLCPILR